MIDTVYITRCKSNKHIIAAMTAFELGELLLFFLGGGVSFLGEGAVSTQRNFTFALEFMNILSKLNHDQVKSCLSHALK